MNTYSNRIRHPAEFIPWQCIGGMPQPIRALWQAHCLRDLIRKAYQTQAYRTLWHNAHFSSDKFRLDDLWKLPVIDEDFFRTRRPYEYLLNDRGIGLGAARYVCDNSGQPRRYFQDYNYQGHLAFRKRRSEIAGYALPAFGVVAKQCPRFRGRHAYHVFDESLILEIVNEDGVKVSDGVRGRIVVTYFDNRYMPFVRYDTGERGSYASHKCLCNKKLFLPDVRKPPSAIIEGDRIIYMRDFSDVFVSYYGFVDRFGIAADGRSLHVQIKAGRFWKDDLLPQLTEQLRGVIGDRTIGIKVAAL